MLTYDIISSVKRTFSRSKKAKSLKDKQVLKDIKGKKGGKMVKCQICGGHESMYKTQIDHIDPICPIMISLKVMSFIMLFERTFCEDKNLQVLCTSCHDKKSKLEKAERVKWRKKKKFLICRHQRGCRMSIIPITNLKELEEYWEVLDVKDNLKDAQSELRKRKKL